MCGSYCFISPAVFIIVSLSLGKHRVERSFDQVSFRKDLCKYISDKLLV